jgi:DNA repair protein RadA
MDQDFLKDSLRKSNLLIDLESELKNFKQKSNFILKSGTNNLDLLLGGGFYSGRSYIFFGENSTGKTQLCHQVCLEAFKSGIKTAYFDSENTFRPERIKELCLTRGLNYNDVLKTILVATIRSDDVLNYKISELDNVLKNSEIKLLLIDTINNYYRLEQGISFEKSKKLFINILNHLNLLTKKYGLISIYTSQVSPNFNPNSTIKHVPVGIQYLNHFFSEFIYLSKTSKNLFMHLVNSSHLRENKVAYTINSKGIIDAN